MSAAADLTTATGNLECFQSYLADPNADHSAAECMLPSEATLEADLHVLNSNPLAASDSEMNPWLVGDEW
jgi:hypothetical protein